MIDAPYKKQFIIHSYAVPVKGKRCDSCSRPAIYTVSIVGTDKGDAIEANVDEQYMQAYYDAQDNNQYPVLHTVKQCGGHLCGYYAASMGESNAIGFVRDSEKRGSTMIVGRRRDICIGPDYIDLTFKQVRSKTLASIVSEIEADEKQKKSRMN